MYSTTLQPPDTTSASPDRPRLPPSGSDGGRPHHVGRSLEGLRVLIVEDHPPSLKLLAAILEGEGCEVCSTCSAEEALVALQSFRPTIAVIDLILPLASGLLLAERLKASPATSELVLIAVSAFNGAEAERTAKMAGFSVYVKKPIDPDAFPALLLATLRGAR
jgi:CheY-like chemotaxis protein